MPRVVNTHGVFFDVLDDGLGAARQSQKQSQCAPKTYTDCEFDKPVKSGEGALFTNCYFNSRVNLASHTILTSCIFSSNPPNQKSPNPFIEELQADVDKWLPDI